MKILKIFGVVAGIHVLALIVIFANPGCSSTSQPIPVPVDTVTSDSPPPSHIEVPMSPTSSAPAPMASAHITFDPNAPAVASSSDASGRYVPTRPGTPVASTLVTAPVTDVTPATTYTVTSGDTLWELQKKFKVPYAEIAAANGIRPSAPLRPGQRLIIPGKVAAKTSPATAPAKSAGAPATKAPAAAANGSSMKHTVRPNETLITIARMYGVNAKELAVRNNISDPQKLRAGAELVIPGWQGTQPPAKAAAAPRTNDRPVEEPAAPAPTPAPIINILDGAPSQPAPADDVPIVPVEDSPLNPTPRAN